MVIVLGNFQGRGVGVGGGAADYDNGRTRSGVRVGVVWTIFLSPIIPLFLLPLSGRRLDIK